MDSRWRRIVNQVAWLVLLIILWRNAEENCQEGYLDRIIHKVQMKNKWNGNSKATNLWQVAIISLVDKQKEKLVQILTLVETD